jgi:beta-lactamase class A
MISVSDNAATDHLLYTLGRKPVEAAMRATKHATPARNIPFLATRELTVMKLNLTEDEIAKYLKMPEAQRRKYLDMQLATAKPDLSKAGDWKAPRHIAELEWFATTGDLCRTMAVLQQRGQKDEKVFGVLSKNPGLEIDKSVFPFAGFKGGGEPGVMNMTWLLRRKDDKWFVVAVTANAPNDAIDANKLIGVAQGVLDLLKAAP